MTLTLFRKIGVLTFIALFASAFLIAPDAAAKKKGKKSKNGKDATAEVDVDASGTGAEADDARATAREKYAEGQTLYDAGNFEDALVRFQAAYDVKPHPVVLKSIAECQAQTGKVSEAVSTLEKYLTAPDITDREAVEARIDELKRAPVKVSVISEPPGAKIEVAGVDTGEVTPALLELAPGEYAVRLSLEGMEPAQENIVVAVGEENTLSVALAVVAPAVVEPVQAEEDEAVIEPFDETLDAPPPAPEMGEEESGPPTAFWAMAAVAGVGLITGTVFGTMALADEKDYKDDPTQAKKEAGQRDAVVADVSFGLAGAAAIAGTIILVVHHRKAKKESARFRVNPVMGKNQAGLTAAFDF